VNLGVQDEPAAKPTLDFGQVDPATLSIPEGVKSSLCVVLRELRRETIAMKQGHAKATLSDCSSSESTE
jgi:hypothetical protein